MKHTPEEIKYRLSDLGVQIGNIAIEYITELEKEVTRLRNENLDIINKYTGFAETDRRTIADLEAQIEKMKCCSNCDFIFRDGNCYYDKECKNKDHWKLRR